jgi:two-component system, OmpR family, sensor kinase
VAYVAVVRSRLSAFVARLPVRVRVTLAFTAAMAVLLAASGAFLYIRLDHTLDDTVDQGLRGRADDLSALIGRSNSGLSDANRSPLTEQGESIAQVLDARGRIVDSVPGLQQTKLLTSAQVRRARTGTIVFDTDQKPVPDIDSLRVLATPLDAQGRSLILVVGASLEGNEEVQHEFGALLAIGGPILLLIAALAGYAAAAAALRPVELMRRRAQEIRATRPGRRLPVPPADDEVSRLGKTLNEMLERLEEAFARERAFVADASHELRTPLAILKGELELAMRDAKDVAEFRRSVGSATEEVDRLVQLAEDLLVVARIEQGRLPVRLEEVRLDVLLDSVAQRFGPRAAEQGIELRVVPAGTDTITADHLRLEQALGNLIDNALRYGAGPVEVSAELHAGSVELHVRDGGAGFRDDFLASAFDRFSRADGARTRGGAGLGLSIVQTIAEAHDGEAHARNRAAGGADVWLALPRVREHEPADA